MHTFLWIVSLIVVFVLGYIGPGFTHRHKWTGWTGWIEERPHHNVVVWTHQRRCRDCNRAEKQAAGRHDCTMNSGPCPHRDQMAVLLDDPVTLLERDLGLGDGK